MASTTNVEEVIAKAKRVEIEPKTGIAIKVENTDGATPDTAYSEKENRRVNGEDSEEVPKDKKVEEEKPKVEETLKEEVALETEPKTGVTFPVKLDDGKQLKTVGVRKKTILAMGIKIYGFGIYADNEKLKELVQGKIGKAPAKPTKELYQAVVDGDIGMAVRMVIVYSNLTMNMVKKSFDEGLRAAIKKLTGKKNDELTTEYPRVLGQASDDIKLSAGSVIEIAKVPGYVLQTTVKGEVVSTAQNELLCRAFIYLYLGDDAFDKDAKEKFGMSLLSLF
ncbi:Chalcone isomerase [Dillenia turbinata]|uniref:Chalcone isomerase n=1 Tax=Dillenia turbinata TaxID=194707 RepID=A0AAN8YRX3_9MAGN